MIVNNRVFLTTAPVIRVALMINDVYMQKGVFYMKKYVFTCFCIALLVFAFSFPAQAQENGTGPIFYLPETDGFMQPFIGDCMPYYEDGVYYIYYLKEGGDSYHHAVYLLTTTDFITYEEYDDPVLEAGDAPAQDDWIGTGSLVKVDQTYYLFYTGHTDSDAFATASRPRSVSKRKRVTVATSSTHKRTITTT